MQTSSKRMLAAYGIRCLMVLPLIVIWASTAQADTGVIVALTSTVNQLQSQMRPQQIIHHARREFIHGRIGEIDLVLVRSPMGMTHNAVTAQLLLDRFAVERVITIAPAGAVDAELKIGDAIIATHVYQHDSGTIKPYGFIWSKVPDGSNWKDSGHQRLDANLVNTAFDLLQKEDKNHTRVHRGIVVSGSQFIAGDEKKEWLHKKFKAQAVDMGAAAIAQVCYANQVPCLIIRVITDRAGLNARDDFLASVPTYRTEIDIPKFLKAILPMVTE